MPDTSHFEISSTKVILVALADLYDPVWNPRDFFDEEEMQSLMDFIQAGGRIEPIVIWTPSPENTEGEPMECDPWLRQMLFQEENRFSGHFSRWF